MRFLWPYRTTHLYSFSFGAAICNTLLKQNKGNDCAGPSRRLVRKHERAHLYPPAFALRPSPQSVPQMNTYLAFAKSQSTVSGIPPEPDSRVPLMQIGNEVHRKSRPGLNIIYRRESLPWLWQWWCMIWICSVFGYSVLSCHRQVLKLDRCPHPFIWLWQRQHMLT